MNNLERIQDSIDYIEENLEKKISLDDIANRAYLSKFHFHRLFHSAVGESIGDYIRKRRLSEAARELRETNEKIIDIAFKYQFNSQESFTRSFRKNYGLSPSEYRRKHEEKILLRKIEISRKKQNSTSGIMLRAA